MHAKKDFEASVSEIANRSQSILGLAALLRRDTSANADLAVKLEGEIAALVRAVRQLQQQGEK
jgi:hypothetical protein